MKIMKNIRYILACIASLAILSSCAKEITGDSTEKGTDGKGTAVFTFTPNFGDEVQTKAMSLDPADPTDPHGSSIKNIYFAVFDAAGFKLSEYAEAIPNSYATENGVVYSYSVKLSVTDEKRIVHIIANAPDRLKYGTEEEVIGSLCTYLDAEESGEFDRQDAYWERIVLENGVHAEPDIALKTDNPAEYAIKYAAYMDVVETLNEAKLTRNFTQLTLSNKATNFEVTGFMLENVPARGSIAPYNRNSMQFQEDYEHWTSILDMIDKTKGNYQGFTPAGTEIISYSDLTEEELQDMLIAPEGSAFCYEREVPKNNPLYVIIAGIYKDGIGVDVVTYYKIDLRDQDKQYFPVLRNFNYRVNINTVSRDGAATIKEALASSPAGSDISTSLDLKELTNISDGEARMFISETDVVIVGKKDAEDTDVVSPDDQKVYLQYKFIPKITEDTPANITKEQWIANWKTANPGKTDAEAEAALEAGNTPYVTITRTLGDGSTAVFKTAGISVNGSDETGTGFRKMTLTPFAPDAIIKTETITITGHYKNSKGWQEISRETTFHLREMLNMTLSCSPSKIPNTAGEAVDVVIGLEAGLPSAIFSLDMNIEANGLSLTPNGDLLPVTSAYSTIPGKSATPSFYYTKTITWTNYLEAPIVSTPDGDFKYFTCHFKTNKAVPSSETIYVSNQYFNQANTTFTTFDAEEFSGLTYKKSSTTVTDSEIGDDLSFSFSMSAIPSDNKVKVYMLGVESTDSNLNFVGTDDEGYEIYEMSVSSTSGSFTLSPYSVGTATIKLEADEFRAESKDIEVLMPGSKKYTLASKAINVYRVSAPAKFSNGTVVSYYYSDPKSGGVHPAGSFTLNSDSRNNSAVEITAISGSTIYFSAEYNGKTYYGSANIDDLGAAENTSAKRYDLILNTNPPYVIPSLYADDKHTDASAINLVSSLTGTDVTEKGQLAVGQKGKLTVYVSEQVASIQIGSLTANRVASGTGATITKDGKTYYAYTTTSDYTAASGSGTGGAGTNALEITYDGVSLGTVNVPVWGLTLGSKLTSVSFDTNKYYVIQNNSTNKYLYNKESTTNANRILRSTWDISSLVKFGNTKSQSTVAFVKVNSNTQYYLGSSGNSNVALSTTSYSWTITETFRFSRNSSRYIYDNNDSNGTIAISNSGTENATRYWNIYPVTIVDPATL